MNNKNLCPMNQSLKVNKYPTIEKIAIFSKW
jgi:hypothetical protein